MTSYAFKRAGHSLLVIWGAFTLSFVVLWALPGDQVSIMLGQADGGLASLSAAQVAALRARLGLNQPLLVQYLVHLRGAVAGNFGASFVTGQPALHMIAQALPPTLALTGSALLLGALGGSALAITANVAAWRGVARLLAALPSLIMSLPVFLVGLLLVHVVAFEWGWFPAVGNGGPRGLVLPAVTLALPVAATVAQVLGRSLAAALAEPYVALLRAKGASELRIVVRHCLRNAAVPTLTITGLLLGNLLAGSVVVETVFSRSGLGSLIATAIEDKDTPLVLAVTVLSAAAFGLISFALDLFYPLIDPRVAGLARGRAVRPATREMRDAAAA